MSERIDCSGLQIAPELHAFVVEEALPGTGLQEEDFFTGLARLLGDLAPRNAELLDVRDRLQTEIDAWHREHPGQIADPEGYRAFLEEIGYLVPDPGPVTISPSGIDREIAEQAGPQLVVPLLNARFALNAANARYGSLYDALYGTDAIDQSGDLAPGDSYNPHRGAAVIARGREVLDASWPLAAGSHTRAQGYRIDEGALRIELADGTSTGLADPDALVGYRGAPESPSAVILRRNGLHAEILIDRDGRNGAGDAAGIDDIVLESAVTTIMDLEDSVAAVDAEDKVLGYRNWLQLMDGTLSAEVCKGGERFTRRLAEDRPYTTVSGEAASLPGRSLLFIRNVGHLMTTDAILDQHGQEVPEGILDTVFTALGSLRDIRAGAGQNSRAGSMYIVKPKMHGPEEVAFAVELFARVEALLGLDAGTIKIGIMDEERRTTVNLGAAIAAAAERIAFINTGFLDRTGDEIHTSLQAGPMVPKAGMKSSGFLAAYEDRNVDIGLASGFSGRAQIGKGMWAMPDRMAEMLSTKGGHPRAGASTAWVPSPTAATLHALHYHEVDVAAVQRELADRPLRDVAEILVPPLASEGELDGIDLEREIDLNVQSILGYVVRWVDQGVGCSKVPDIDDIGLMEDRATLRISSQLLANWLRHGVVSIEQVDASLQRLAPVVDRQNAGDPSYEALIGPDGPGIAFTAARDLIVLGAEQPSGYTEPLLHARRRQKKATQHT